jgi:hypothetical protein
VSRDEIKRAIILLLLIVSIFAITAIIAPCDGSCPIEEEVRRG